MRYRKVLSVQTCKKRFENAIARARRLLGLPTTLSLKWRSILTSPIPVALYAIQIVPLGLKHFQTLRSSIADVVCRFYRS